MSALALLHGAGAQDSPPRSAEQPPVFQAQAHAVLVDVVVTKNGQPALHLQKQDFQVLDDGKLQTIDFFQEHPSPPAAAPPIASHLPPHAFTNQPTTPPVDEVSVLLLDKLSTSAADQGVFIDGVRRFVRNLRPGTPIAVFTLGSRLRLVQGFTGDPAQLQAAMSGKDAPESGTSTIAHTAQDGAMNQLQSALAGVLGMHDSSAAPMDQIRANERSALTLDALNALARYLAGIPGRKNLIWYASDFPLAIFPDARASQTLAQDRGFGARVRATTGLLAAARVAVYPVSAAGISNDSWTEAANRSESFGAQQDINQQTSTEQNARAASIAAMEQIASSTGGQAIYTTNDLTRATSDAIRNGASYYTLAYTPSNTKSDGSFHRIEVKLTGHKEKLEYRRGYFADDGAAPDAGSDPLIPLLANGLPSATQIVYRVSAVPASAQPAPTEPAAGGNHSLSGPLTRFSVAFILPTDGLDLTSTNDGAHGGKLEVALVAYDRTGKAVNWTGGATAINLSAASWAAAQRGGIPLRLQLDLPNEPLTLATGVYDLMDRKAGTLQIPLAQPANSPPAGVEPHP